jgi:multiple sugar transport system permease protein
MRLRPGRAAALEPHRAGAAPGVARRSRRALARELEGWLFVSPWVIGFVLFTAAPYLASMVLAFMRWDMGRTVEFVGLRNFAYLFFEDELFRLSIWNTLYYTVFHVPGTVVVSFVLAGLLNVPVKGLPLYRTMFYLPSVTSGVGMALIWIWLFAPNGVVNGLIGLGGIRGPNWLFAPEWAMPALILMSFWTIGTTMVLFLAGLQGIPQQLYEAVEVDGGGWWARVRHVTIPMMTPYIFLSVVLNVIGSFQVFTTALIMTNGGPDNATLFVLLHLYNNAWISYRLGYASAMAWVLVAIVLTLTVMQFRIARRWVYYEYSDRD